MYQGSYFTVDNFSGGYCGNLSLGSLQTNQALDLDNIVIAPDGGGWRTRLGNSKINTNGLVSGASFPGLGFYRKSAGSEWIVGICGSKFVTNSGSSASQSFNASFTDSTGTLTITPGDRNPWDFLTFNDTLIAFGGANGSPDAPFKWTGSGNAALLTGSPPSANGAFTTNNRIFAFNSAANPSTIYWTILGNAEDWTGVGSGNAVAGSLNDNQTIIGAAVLSTNYAIIFKETSAYMMVLSAAPFPIYTLYDKMGCIGRKAIVNVDGTIYWINQYRRMVSTNGNSFQEYPPNADDLFDAINFGQSSYVVGWRQKGTDYDWLVWSYDTAGSSLNSKAIIWDLKNKCWLRCTTGMGTNAACLDRFGHAYMGGTSFSFVYKMDQSGVYADASETVSAITGYWRSGWLNKDSLEKIIQVNELGAIYKTRASGSITLKYGFDYVADSGSSTISQMATGSETYAAKYIKVNGRGNFFNYKVSQSSTSIDSVIQQIMLRGKIAAQKVFTNP